MANQGIHADGVPAWRTLGRKGESGTPRVMPKTVRTTSGGRLQVLFAVYFYGFTLLGLLLVMAGTFVLLTRDHWIDKLMRRNPDDSSARALVRRQLLGLGVSLLTGGVIAIGQPLYLLLTRG